MSVNSGTRNSFNRISPLRICVRAEDIAVSVHKKDFMKNKFYKSPFLDGFSDFKSKLGRKQEKRGCLGHVTTYHVIQDVPAMLPYSHQSP